ncbi:MAG: HD domain-containing protein [Halobacteriales archaeon]|nr:HD domain-containing protein [Halobacteriales archaeon]
MTAGEPSTTADGPFDAIADLVSEELAADASGHDLRHAWRVFRLARRLAAAEGGDPEIVGAAALTHDLHRVRGADDEYVDPAATIPTVREILRSVDFPAEKIEAVCHCVAVHDEYGFDGEPSAAETIEAEILQDADNLDAIGAVGIARTFKYAGANDQPMWLPAVEVDADAVADSVYRPDGSDSDTAGTSVGHFHEKLLRLKDDMNTDTAHEIAVERHRFMETFLDRFKREWQGEA